jgi:hypothetical protein
MKRTILALCALATLALAGCMTTVHNDQRTCTTDCNIGSSDPVYAPVQVAPSLTYHPYRRYRRSPVIIYHY